MSEEKAQWYDERINISPEKTTENILKIKKEITEEIINEISKLFETKISSLEKEIIKLREDLTDQKELNIRKQNMLIRQHVPVPFIPNHTNSFSEIRSNIMKKSKNTNSNIPSRNNSKNNLQNYTNYKNYDNYGNYSNYSNYNNYNYQPKTSPGIDSLSDMFNEIFE